MFCCSLSDFSRRARGLRHPILPHNHPPRDADRVSDHRPPVRVRVHEIGDGRRRMSAQPMGAPSVPNVVTVLIDDMDLERIPFYPRLDEGAAWQLRTHLRGGGCRSGANCTYSAPHIEAVGARGARFLGAHVPVSVCTPSRYALLTGRLPSSSPFYSATLVGHAQAQVDVSWNTWIEQGTHEDWAPCCGPGVPQPCVPARRWGCTRRAATLGSMLQRAGYFTGFVGKWHLSPVSAELKAWHRGVHGTFPDVVTADSAAAAAALQAGYAAQRERDLAPSVRRAGFNYTGALSVGNVVDLGGLGLALHNLDWEAHAALQFLDRAASHVAARRAAAYFLHVCTTLTHSPGPSKGICADPRLSEGGLLDGSPSGLPSRASVLARTGRSCAYNLWQEYDASHTLWVDDAVGALLGTSGSLRLTPEPTPLPQKPTLSPQKSTPQPQKATSQPHSPRHTRTSPRHTRACRRLTHHQSPGNTFCPAPHSHPPFGLHGSGEAHSALPPPSSPAPTHPHALALRCSPPHLPLRRQGARHWP